MNPKKIFCIALLLLLTGCSLRDTTNSLVTFIEDSEIEITSDFSVCGLVSEIENISITDLKITDNEIINNKDILKCNISNEDISVGEHTYKFEYKKNNYEKTITLVDTTPPVVDGKAEYKVEVGNTYFDIKNQIKVTDNSSDEVLPFLTGTYDLNKIGKYPIEIKYIDTSNNETIFKTTINVVEKEKEVVEKEVIKETPPTNNGGTSSGSGETPPSNNGGIDAPTNSPSTDYSMNGKMYYFKDGYDFVTGPQACHEDLKRSGASGECVPVHENKQPVAIKLIIY